MTENIFRKRHEADIEVDTLSIGRAASGIVHLFFDKSRTTYDNVQRLQRSIVVPFLYTARDSLPKVPYAVVSAVGTSPSRRLNMLLDASGNTRDGILAPFQRWRVSRLSLPRLFCACQSGVTALCTCTCCKYEHDTVDHWASDSPSEKLTLDELLGIFCRFLFLPLLGFNRTLPI